MEEIKGIPFKLPCLMFFMKEDYVYSEISEEIEEGEEEDYVDDDDVDYDNDSELENYDSEDNHEQDEDGDENDDDENNDIDEEVLEEENEEDEDHIEESTKYKKTFYSVLDRKSYTEENVEKINPKNCYISSQGWCLFFESEMSNCFLLDPITMQQVQLPSVKLPSSSSPVTSKSICKLVLSSSPISSSCVIMFACLDEDRLIFCKLSSSIDSKWASYDYSDQFGEERILIDITFSNGQFYGLTSEWNIVIIDIDPHPRITFIEMECTFIQNPFNCCILHPSFLDSCGELFCVARFVSSGSADIAFVAIYKADLIKRTWNKMNSIGDRIFFLDKCNKFSASRSGKELGLKSDSIYFTMPRRCGMRIYNIKEGSFLTNEVSPRSGFEPLWILPPVFQYEAMGSLHGNMPLPCSDGGKKEMKEKGEIKQANEANWCDLPWDILRLIEFKYIVSNVGTKGFNYAFAADICPLLICKKSYEDKTLHYYSPAYNRTFTAACPYDLSGTVIRLASNGWLLLSRGDYEFLLVNPLKGTTRKLADIGHKYKMNVCAFSSPPSTHLPDNFMIFGISWQLFWVSVNLYTDGHWLEEKRFKKEYDLELSDDCSPVYRNGLFYCMSMDGRIATYNPTQEMWTCHDKPRPIRKFRDDIFLGDKCYFIGLKGQLVSFFTERKRKRISMFKLNEQVMAWERLTSCTLDRNEALFLGSPTPLRVWENEMSNKVFSAKIRDEQEITDAEIREFQGRFFFFPKKYVSCRDADEENLKGVCCRSLEDKALYDFKVYKKWTVNMWYDPMYF